MVALLSGSAAPAWAADSAELKKIEGRWLVAHRYYKPSKVNTVVGKLLTELGHEVEIKDGKLSACDPKKAGQYLLLEIDPAARPKAIDLKVPDKKDQVLLGIYRLEDDVLSVAVGAGGQRPKAFMNPNGQVLLVLKRASKKTPAASGPAPR
jgi:uncharacterized protein (TIGR03067 family)